MTCSMTAFSRIRDKDENGELIWEIPRSTTAFWR